MILAINIGNISVLHDPVEYNSSLSKTPTIRQMLAKEGALAYMEIVLSTSL